MFHNAVLFKQKLCGAAWLRLRSKARKAGMFKGSSGSIMPRKVCKSAPTRRHASRPRVTKRELKARTPITAPSTPDIASTIAHAMKCSKCGTFKKSGRVSCCAPGGAWYKNCASDGNRNAYHSWSEGVDACQRKFNCNCQHVDTSSLIQHLHGVSVVIAIFVCECLSVFDRCVNLQHTRNHDGVSQFLMLHMRDHREIRQSQLLRSRRFLVRNLRRTWRRKT